MGQFSVEKPVPPGSALSGNQQSSLVKMIGNPPPALICLAFDIGLTGLALSVERVEREIEIMLGGFARVDRAALGLGEMDFRARRSC